MTPTIASLMKLAAALGKSVSYFVDEPEPLRPSHRRPRDDRSASTRPSRASTCATSRAATAPSGRRRRGRRRAARRQRARPDEPPGRGARVILEGLHACSRSTASRRPRGGDSIHFRTTLPHSWANPTDKPARAIRLASAAPASMRIAVASAATRSSGPARTAPGRSSAQRAASPSAPGGCAAPATSSCSRTATAPRSALLALQQELGEPERPALPLDALIAMTQGQIGYLLENALASSTPTLPIATLLDPRASSTATTTPSRPRRRSRSARSTTSTRRAGSPTRAAGMSAPDAGRGWRRVVPSPRPHRGARHEHIELLPPTAPS